MSPSGVYVDPGNRVYIADSGGSLVRVVDSTGNINIVFGNEFEGMAGSIGLPDTEATVNNVGPADGVDDMTMDPYGNLIASDSSGSAITSAGATGQYIFPGTPSFTTKTTTQANATSPFYPPYLTISNPSGVTLTFTGTPLVTGPFAIVTGTGAGTCTFPGSLAPGQTCTVVVSFTPTLGGSPGTVQTGSIVLASNANSSPSSINLSGTGTGVATISATLTPSPLIFTSQAGVTSAAQQATLTNTGQAPIAVGSTDFDGVSTSNFAVSATTGPTGAATLAVGATCTYSITFTPTLPTTYTAGFQSCISTSSYGCTQINLQGTGTAATTATLLTSPLAFGSVVQNQTSAAMTATLNNTGSATLNITSFGITGTNPADFAVATGTNACGSTLAAGASCLVYVTFTPASATSFSARLSVADNASTSPQTVSLSGTGTAPQAAFNPIAIAFGNQTVNTTSAVSTSQIFNAGSATLTISSLTITGANASAFTLVPSTTSPCGATLAAQTGCNISVTFTPTTATSYSASVSLVDNATGSPQTLPLTGTGTAVPLPLPSLNPVTLAFSNQTTNTTSSPLSTILSNASATANLNISSISITGTNANAFAISGNGCPSSLGQSSCTISVTFTPPTTGSFSAMLSVADNATGSPQTVALTGTGIAPTTPQAVLAPNPLAFPSTTVATSATALPMTLSNPGTAALAITSIAVTGANAGSFGQTNNCPASLAAGSSCTITVSFTPSSATSLSAAISVVDNATGSPQSAALTGTGLAAPAPVAVLAPIGLSFPSTTVASTSAVQTLTLSNSGTATLNITSIAIAGANPTAFAQTNNCGTTLAVSATCTISVSFTPSSVTSFSGTVVVSDNSSSSQQSSTLSGSGIAVLAPQALLSPTSLSFPSTTINTSATPLPITLSNPGNTALTITRISLTGANASSFGQANNCPASLAAGATCTITVSFSPASASTFNAAISVVDNAVGTPQSVAVTGIGSAGTYVVTATTPTQTVEPGAVAQFNLIVAPLGGSFNNLITMSSTGLPPGATASFLPPAVTPGSAGAPTVLSVQTATGLARLSLPASRPQNCVPLLALLAGVPLLGLAGRLRRLRQADRRWMLLVLAALAILPILALSGCGGGYFGPAPKTYTITVIGTGGSLQESTTITLTVE